jgi:hypothetical protein
MYNTAVNVEIMSRCNLQGDWAATSRKKLLFRGTTPQWKDNATPICTLMWFNTCKPFSGIQTDMLVEHSRADTENSTIADF